MKGYILIVISLGALYVQSFFLGQYYAQKEMIKENEIYEQNLWTLRNEIWHMDNYVLCLKLGGLPQACSAIMQKSDTAAGYQ